MRFLDPISGIVAAAIAVPLLLLLYLLRLRRKTLRVSSTLLWEQAFADLQVNVPFRWLRLSTLLILQFLALGALIAALARPAIRGAAPIADRIVIIIDQSASMSARDGVDPASDIEDPSAARPTRLDEAKRRAIQTVRELQRSSGTGGSSARPSITVMTSAATARTVQPPTTLTADAIDAITRIEPTDVPGGIGAAMELLKSTRVAAGDTGDSTVKPNAAGEQVLALTDDPPAITPRSLRIVRVGPPLTEAPPDNLGFVALSVRRDDSAPDTIRVFARIATPAPLPITSNVRVTLDGRVMASQAITVNRSAVATFELSSREGGVVLVTIDRLDRLDADNIVGAVIGPASSPSILVVTPAGESPEAGADPFLLGFLESISPRALRTITSSTYQSEVQSARAERRRPFSTVDLVIFDRTEPSLDAVPIQPTISFGAGLPVRGLSLTTAGIATTTTASRSVRFDTWRRTHPLMRYVGLDPIIVSPPPAIIATDAPAPSPNQSLSSTNSFPITVLAAGQTGPLIAALEEPGFGGIGAASRPRHIVIAFPLRNSNWAADTSFAVFMTNAIDTMLGSGGAAEGWSFTTGVPMLLRPTPGATRLEAAGPETLAVTVDASPTGPVSLGVPQRAGLYRLSGAIDTATCVNLLSESETLLGRANAAATLPDQASPPENATPAESATANDRGRSREIWHWFILAAMALASIEWLIFARASRA